jgi:hypothetical protein
MQNAIHAFLVDSRHALAIWAGLIAVSIGAFGLLSLTTRHSWYGTRLVDPEQRSRQRTILAARLAELRRYAEEITVAAGRAGSTAERHHAAWAAAHGAVEAAWRAYDAADTAARRATAAAAIAVPHRTLTPAEVAMRERFMHRVATDAYYRGDLAIEQLLDALSSRNGWNPCLHPADQETVMLRIARQRRLRAFLAATAAERTAWRDAEFATAARVSLDNEVLGATAEVDRAAAELAVFTPQPRRGGPGAVALAVRHAAYRAVTYRRGGGSGRRSHNTVTA